ncbi:MAG: DUF4325 domain-containing protein [Vicinamibacteria bacterium]
MKRVRSSGAIRAWILGEVEAGRGADLAARGAQQFGITRQAMSRYLRALISQNVLAPTGNTRARQYAFAIQKRLSRTYITLGLQEHEVWSADLLPLLADLPPNVRSICEYGATEILNNAIDHSESPTVTVTLERTAVQVRIMVMDDGIGIFRKVREARQLQSDREAILEITKGKITTDPTRHTGEGIFFTSRMMDSFVIFSDALGLIHRRASNDWLFENPARPAKGTTVTMHLDPASEHTMEEVFDRYRASQDDYAFARTHVVLALADTEGGSLVSRSQAKRVMLGLERFREALLDFRRVPTIGPAFADEVFRVWKRAHPNTTLVPIGPSEAVSRMIARTESAEPEPAG